MVRTRRARRSRKQEDRDAESQYRTVYRGESRRRYRVLRKARVQRKRRAKRKHLITIFGR